MKQNKLTNRALSFAIAGLLMQTSQVLAEPLNLEFGIGGSDIAITSITFFYNATDDILSATGTAVQYDSDTTDTSDFTSIADGSFSLSAGIDNTGNFSSGSFTITGDIGSGTTDLLTGDLTDFGFATNGAETLEFVFDVTGGSESGVFGTSGGLIIGQSGLPSASPFSNDWNNELLPGFGGFGTADAKSPVVPEPAEYSLIFGVISFLGFFFNRKLSSK